LFEDIKWQSKDQQVTFRHRAALALIGSPARPGLKILDLGCGDGLFLQLLKEARGIDGMGVDFSREAAAKAAKRGVKIKVHNIAQLPLPFPNGSFDCVVLLDVLEHLYFPEALLGEAVRISREDIIISVPNFNHLKARWQMLWGKVPENNVPKKGHVYWFNHRGLQQLLKKNGLRVADLQLNTYWENVSLLGWFIKILAKLFPSVFALSFVIMAEKSRP